MEITHCPHCGGSLERIVNRPIGCICDENEWNDPLNLPPVCNSFEGDDIGGHCIRCEHDYACHTHDAKFTKSTTPAQVAGFLLPETT